MVRATRETRRRLRWEATDGDDADPRLFETGPQRITHPEFRGLEFIHVDARSLINEVPRAANLPFRYTINVYRGCSHACSYCFARPTHEYLGLNAGRDFERVIVVKVNAPELLRRELHPGRWAGEQIAMGTNTDPYQRCEGRYRLTRRVLETLTEFGNPFSVLTKSALVTRDLDVLREAARRAEISVSFSIGTLDTEVWRTSEPGTSHPRSRIEALAALSEAGIHTGVLVAPVLPGISDGREQLEQVVRASLDAGASSVSPILLHLRPGVREVFMPWLTDQRPDLVDRYERTYTRAHAPTDQRRRIGRIVADLVQENGGTPERSTSRREPPPPPPHPPAGPPDGTEQLRLEL